MPTRNGKIANLPNEIREQLNLRLLEGETGKELAAWLNALPCVQSILASQFNGSPISEVNLTYWRQGGYLQWFTERECFDSARALANGACNLGDAGLSAERLLNMLTLRYGELLLRWDFSSDESVPETAAFVETARRARILQGISRSVLSIHRIQSQQPCSSISQKQRNANSSTNRTEKNAPVETAFDSSADHNDAMVAESPASAALDPSPQSPRPSSAHRAPKLPPSLTAAPLHPFSAFGDAEASPKILSGPIAPSSVHSKLSHAPLKTARASADALDAA